MQVHISVFSFEFYLCLHPCHNVWPIIEFDWIKCNCANWMFCFFWIYSDLQIVCGNWENCHGSMPEVINSRIQPQAFFVPLISLFSDDLFLPFTCTSPHVSCFFLTTLYMDSCNNTEKPLASYTSLAGMFFLFLYDHIWLLTHHLRHCYCWLR